jgi:hypothetical protein
LKVLEAVQHRVQAEVHRAHVQRGHLGRVLQRGLQALLDRHVAAPPVVMLITASVRP